MTHVFICRAHSRREPGFCVPNKLGLNEWYLSEEFCRGAVSAFEKSNHEVEMLGASLGVRIACIKSYCRKHPGVEPVAVEMHCNSMPGRPLTRGYFCMAWHNSAAAVELSREINREIRMVRPENCRGVNKVSHNKRWVGTGMEYEDRPLGFLENVPCPSVLVEAGYLSSPIDAAWLKERDNRHSLGRAVGRGILNFLEVK